MICLSSIKKAMPLLLISLLAIISCSESKYVKETGYFENYLKQVFNKKISSSKEYYFIIPNSGCMGCRTSVLNFMLGKDFNSRCIGIISQPDDETANLILNKKNILVDEKGKIDRLNLQTANTVLIITENECVEEIIPITVENVDKINQYLK